MKASAIATLDRFFGAAAEKTDCRGHDSRAVANYFVDLAFEASRRITILPLVKLVYFAHGWTLGYTGKPLIRDRIEAWRMGSVIPEVYFAFRPQGIIIREHATNWLERPYKESFKEEEKRIMKGVYGHYSVKDISVLIGLTRLPGTPWSKNINTSDKIISDEAIKEYYDNIIESRKK